MSKELANAMAELNEEEVLKKVTELKNKNVPALDIIASLQEGMSIVGKRFEKEEYFLSELVMSAEIFKLASNIIGDCGSASSESKYGTFVMGTIYGDIHDIGKDIVVTVMRSNGFNVVDLGVDVSTAKYIEAIKTHKPTAIGISCLLTTVFDNVRECIKSIEEAGLRKDLKILIGGGPVDEATGRYVGADFVGKNAQQAIEYCTHYSARVI